MATDVSYLMPADFDYLRRGGRLSPLVSLVGKTIECYTLPPAFITQGGPSCVAVQVVKEI